MKKFVCVVLTVAITGIFAGCPEKGPLEKAGERTDEAIEDVKDSLDPRGPLEKAGAKADEAVDEVME